MVLRLLNLFLELQDQKTLKRVKILKSLFRDFLISVNQIDHEESENHGPETQRFILCDPGRKNNLSPKVSTQARRIDLSALFRVP